MNIGWFLSVFFFKLILFVKLQPENLTNLFIQHNFSLANSWVKIDFNSPKQFIQVSNLYLV